MVRTFPFLLGLSLFATSAFAAESVPLADLAQRSKALDGKTITVRGTVAEFEQRKSKAGNAYFVFKLKEKDAVVNVYGRGTLKPAAKDGAKVDVTGTYRLEKKVGKQTFKNEIETDAKSGVKPAK